MRTTDKHEILNFLTTNLEGGAGLGAGLPKPTLKEAYAVYKSALAPKHRHQLLFVSKLADFSEVLRGIGKASLYSDEEWIEFIVSVDPKMGSEEARDLWDAYVCQPEY